MILGFFLWNFFIYFKLVGNLGIFWILGSLFWGGKLMGEI